MTKGRQKSLIRRLHGTVGWLLALFILIAAGTGILLQHPTWLGPEENQVLCLAVDPDDSGRLYRGTHWGVEVSRDGGESWREVPMLIPPTDVRRILFAPGPASGRGVLALGADGLVVSSDGGTVWTPLSLPLAVAEHRAEVLDLAVQASGAPIILTTGGTFRFDADQTWRALGDPLVANGGARRWIHDLHTGNIAGLGGRRVVETGAWGLVVLTVSGLLLLNRNRRRNRT